jgi:hypothetical protein
VISSGSGAAGFYSRLYLFDGVESSGVGGGGMKFFVLCKKRESTSIRVCVSQVVYGGEVFF